MGYIYKITNKINNKIYIGQTIKKRPTDRFSQHRYAARHLDQNNGISYLHQAMNKDGVDNFDFDIIEEIDNNLLNEREKYWINFYNCRMPNGYNMTNGGEGTQGYSRPQSVEEREKRKESNKQFYIDHPEEKEKISERSKKLWENEEYRDKVKEGLKQFHEQNPDKFKGKNNPMYGKKHTKEALEKIQAHAATTKSKIAQLDKDSLEILQIYDGIRDAEKALGVSHGWISKAAKQNKVAYGFRWKIIEEV